VSATRDFVGKAMLHAPPWVRSIRNIPLVGRLVHGLSHRILPSGHKVWAQIKRGPARGLWIQVNPRVASGFIQGTSESEMQQIISEYLKPGMVFFDLGANIGLFTLLAARLVGESGKVFSFEPDQENAGRLRENVARNKFTNVTIVEVGVWSTTGELSFLSGPPTSPDRAWGRFVKCGDGAGGVRIRCVSLDDFVQNAAHPDAIKCDVEGAEVEALRGSAKLLGSQRPWIVCETHSTENSQTVRELLKGHGYEIEAIDATHLLARV
jgi:FkbM family methyltransferase